jgi:hypothetical protein
MIVDVAWKQTVARDLVHCPAPLLTRFRGEYWLFYNAPKPGYREDGLRVMVAHSPDGGGWSSAEPVTHLAEIAQTAGCFVRDGRLYLLFTRVDPEALGASAIEKRAPTYVPPRQAMLTWTDDGTLWSEPRACCEPGWMPWKARVHDGSVYAAFYWEHGLYSPELARCALFRLSDAGHWVPISTISAGRAANETELLFLGERLIAVSRRGNRAYNALLSMAWPPYRAWYQEELPLKANGPGMGFVGPQPILVARDPQRSPGLFAPPPAHCRMTLWLWNREGFERAADLEEGTDIGYPSIQPAADDPNASLMAYYVEDEVRVVMLRYAPLSGMPPLCYIRD